MRAGEIVELNTFLSVAEEGRFSAAAVQLGVTASAVSQSIRRLEERLGLRLFVRTTRSVALTEAGDALLRQVKPAMDQLARAEGALAPRRSQLAGRARISVSAAAMEMLVAPILPGFSKAHPDFALDIVVEDRIADPVARRYDAVIRRGGLLEKDMIARRLSKDDRLVLVASDRYLAEARPLLHPRDLGRDRIVIRRPRSGASLPWTLSRNRETVRIDGDISLTVDSAIAARQFAIVGLGVALLAEEFVTASLECGLLRVILPDWQHPAPGFHLMYVHRGELPPYLWELERAIRQRVDQRSASEPH